MKVAFDVDGCLKNYDGSLRHEVCELLIAFLMSGFEVMVWSGGGKDYAMGVWRSVVREYQLEDGMSDLVSTVTCKMKDDSKPDLAFDDENVNLGKFNVRLDPRIAMSRRTHD
jgi:hypothetical protein